MGNQIPVFWGHCITINSYIPAKTSAFVTGSFSNIYCSDRRHLTMQTGPNEYRS
jgi:hypothetical protein